MRNDRTSAGNAVLTRGLRAVRVVLSLVFVALLLSAGAGDAATLSGGAARVVVLMACLNALANGFLLVRPSPRAEPAWQAVTQLALDSVLAVVASVVLDPTASPLAWVALLVPVLDAGAAFGPVFAGIVWLSLGLAYVALRLRLLPSDSSANDLVRLGLQQMAAVAAVTIPTGYLAARLRDDLDRAHETLVAAQRWVRELELVAAHSRRLTEAADPSAVLEQTVRAARDLGFAHVDVCRRDDAGVWRVNHSAGDRRSPNPAGDRGLERVAAAGASALIGGGGPPGEIQWLHLTGFSGEMLMPIRHRDGVVAVLRAWSETPLTVDNSRVQALQVLATQAAAAWGTASRYAELAGWSRRVAHEASHDALTGLPNRAQLMTMLERAGERGGRGGAPYALLYLDLNGFKEVNDTHGHEGGDAVLVAIGERLARITRAGETAARLGGDEFVILLDEIDSIRAAVSVAERVCEALSEPIAVNGHVSRVGAAVGIALSRPGDDADALIRAADEAMYRVKRRGITGYAVATRPGPGGAAPGRSDRDPLMPTETR